MPTRWLSRNAYAPISRLAFHQDRTAVGITVGIGVAGSDQFDDPAQVSPGQLLKAADEALYRAKSEGRDRAVSAGAAG